MFLEVHIKVEDPQKRRLDLNQYLVYGKVSDTKWHTDKRGHEWIAISSTMPFSKLDNNALAKLDLVNYTTREPFMHRDVIDWINMYGGLFILGLTIPLSTSIRDGKEHQKKLIIHRKLDAWLKYMSPEDRKQYAQLDQELGRVINQTEHLQTSITTLGALMLTSSVIDFFIK